MRMEGKAKKRIVIAVGLAGVVAGGLCGVAVASLPHTFVAGETLTADNLNSNLTALDQRLAAVESSVTTLNQAHFPSAFRAYTEQAQAVANPTIIVFDKVDFDLASEYNPATGGFTAKQAGYYLVTCGLVFASPSANGYFAAIVYKNGTAVANEASISVSQASATPISATPQTTALIQLAANDTLTCAGAQNSGANQSIQPGFVGRNAFSAAKLF
jgi:hypothetical protein